MSVKSVRKSWLVQTGCEDTCKFFTLKKNDFMYVEVRLILDHLKDGMMYKKGHVEMSNECSDLIKNIDNI